MAFTKAFPKRTDKSAYPAWIDISLTDEEEKAIEREANKENTKLFKECMEEAKNIMKEKDLKNFQTNLIDIAKILFEKRASHVVFWKESKCREKFDKLH